MHPHPTLSLSLPLIPDAAVFRMPSDRDEQGPFGKWQTARQILVFVQT